MLHITSVLSTAAAHGAFEVCRRADFRFLLLPVKAFWLDHLQTRDPESRASVPCPLLHLSGTLTCCCPQDPDRGGAGPEVHPHAGEGEGRLPGAPDPEVHWRARRLVPHDLHQHMQVRSPAVLHHQGNRGALWSCWLNSMMMVEAVVTCSIQGKEIHPTYVCIYIYIDFKNLYIYI